MGRLDQETQVRNSDVYDDTLPPGPGLETPVVADQHILFDLNALRTQTRNIIDPLALPGTADWFTSISTALDNFGLRQIHDKKLVFRLPRGSVNAFVLGAPAAGVLVSNTMVAGGAGIIAVGPTSVQHNAYVAAIEPAFTVAGVLGPGLATALSVRSIRLNEVDLVVASTNSPPLSIGARVFGLLQAQVGTLDGAAITAAPSQILQISFVKIDPATDLLVSVTLPADTYQFSLPFQQSFYDLDRGALLVGLEPAAASSATADFNKIVTAKYTDVFNTRGDEVPLVVIANNGNVVVAL
jgi:hypothetical protein